MDPVLGSTIASFVAGLTGIAIAVVNGKNNAERLRLEDRNRRLERRLIDKHGEDPDDVDDI